MNHYDLIILGTGGVGSAALYAAARRGLKVLGIDQFGPAHAQGSSHGQTRIIRQAYFEHVDYVPLLKTAYELWEDLQLQRCQKLMHLNGLLEVGKPQGALIRGILASANQHDIPLEKFSAAEVEKRFAGFSAPDDCIALFEPTAGYLRVEECVLAHLEQAIKLGAELRQGNAVKKWNATATNATVVLENGETISAGGLIITAGPWSAGLLSDLGVTLDVLRKPLYWYQPKDKVYRIEDNTPCFFYEVDDQYFYGFPQIDRQGVKVAEHSGGHTVTDPSNVDHSLYQDHDRKEQQQIDRFIDLYLPDLRGPNLKGPNVNNECANQSVCMYTVTKDEHFLVDRHPEYSHVSFAAGLSGHGFKFTNVLGQVLVDWIADGKTMHPVEFLSIDRFGLK